MYKGGVPPLPKTSVVVDTRSFNNNGSSLRLYHVWKGSNRFFCGGRLVFGPDFRSLYLTISLIVCPVILFCAFVAPGLVNYFPHHQGYAVVVLCAAFTVYLIVLVILTSGSDPGIIPRNLQPPEPEDDNYSTSTDWAGSQVGFPYLPPTREVPVNGMIIRVKYCQTCMLYRPPRCSHCSICNNCVERFDHHCPWVGQCIGKRNYRFFFMFVFSTSLLCLYVFAFCCVNIKFLTKAHNYSIWKAVAKSPVSGILIIYTFVASWFVGGLTAFHFYLICTNQTTYENFRYRYDRKRNPYNLGCPENLKEILCSKIPKSKNNFRAKVTCNLSSIFSTSSSQTMSPEMQKAIFDANTGKRQAVDAEEFDDIQSQIESMSGLDRCGTQTRPTIWEKNSNIETRRSMHAVPPNFRFEHGIQ